MKWHGPKIRQGEGGDPNAIHNLRLLMLLCYKNRVINITTSQI